MTKDELKAKVSAELKAQGINASDAQIEEALAKVASKQELTEDTLENVAGGGLGDLVKYIPDAIETIKNLFGGGGGNNNGGGNNSGGNNSGGSGSGGSGGPNYNNTNAGGKQMINQGEGNQNDNSGKMTW